MDIARFRALLSECHGHGPQQACGRCYPLLEEAAALSAADCLSGFSLGDREGFESWHRDVSERFRGERAAIETARRWLG